MKTISYAVVVYVLVALSWWSVLLQRKNTEAFEAKAALMKYENSVSLGVADYDLNDYPPYHELSQKYQQQQVMIYGEAIVFILMLICGMWLINRAYQKEINTGKRQQNFLLSITHELKTPLAGIGLIFDTIKKRQLPHDKIISLMETGADEKLRLEKLINNLLVAARIDTAQSYNLEDLDINDLITEITDRYRGFRQNMTIHLDLAESLVAHADREAFVTVITNLVENAIKYRSTSRALRVSLKAYGEEGMVVLKVGDNGIGIDPKEHKQIFDKFYRVGSEETRTTKGTGLGLFIVKKTVERHGGTVSIEPGQPHGSVFVTRWPAMG
jgi:signal transduction histidine kinase